MIYFADTGSHLGATQESIQSSEIAQASAINGRNEQVWI